MEIQGYLFDKDGTLLQLDTYWLAFTEHVARKVQEMLPGARGEETLARLMELAGFDRQGKVIPESPVVAGTNEDIAVIWRDWLAGCGVRVPDGFVSDVTGWFWTDYEHGEVVPTTPKLVAILRELKNRGCRIGVATSDYYDSTCYCLEKLGISGMIDAIYSADRVAKPKPDPETARRACEAWGIPPESLVMVGDSENDMRFARNAGCRGIYLSADGALPDGAQRCIASLDALLDE